MLNIRRCLALSLAVTGALAVPLEVYLAEEEVFQRVWYGDGVAYVGPNIPPDVDIALNITVKSSLGDWLLVEADKENSNSKHGLLNPTFLVGNIDPEARRPFYFAHSAVDLTEEDIYMYVVRDMSSWILTSARHGALDGTSYILPTETEGTYTIHWLVDDKAARKAGAKPVILTTWNS